MAGPTTACSQREPAEGETDWVAARDHYHESLAGVWRDWSDAAVTGAALRAALFKGCLSALTRLAASDAPPAAPIGLLDQWTDAFIETGRAAELSGVRRACLDELELVAKQLIDDFQQTADADRRDDADMLPTLGLRHLARRTRSLWPGDQSSGH